MVQNPITPQQAREALEVLLEQERVLRYPHAFGSAEALALGNAAAQLTSDFDETYTVTITREADGQVVFQWLADDKGARNLMFAAGKRAAALAAGHASPWAQLKAIADEASLEDVWAKVPDQVASCGAFPVRVGEEWVATLAVSGLHEGLDQEVVLRALEKVLGVSAPRFACPVA